MQGVGMAGPRGENLSAEGVGVGQPARLLVGRGELDGLFEGQTAHGNMNPPSETPPNACLYL